jgi:hypothetical protein
MKVSPDPVALGPQPKNIQESVEDFVLIQSVSGEFGNTYCPEAKIPNHFRMETTGVRDGNLENS